MGRARAQSTATFRKDTSRCVCDACRHGKVRRDFADKDLIDAVDEVVVEFEQCGRECTLTGATIVVGAGRFTLTLSDSPVFEKLGLRVK